MNQRQYFKAYSEGKPSCLTAERIRELESVEFVWDPLADVWNERFRELCELREQFGKCLMSLRSSNPKLAKWVTTQRHEYKLYQDGKSSKMIVERIRELESVEFVWDTQLLLFESNDLNNWLNSRHRLVTTSCHNSFVPSLAPVVSYTEQSGGTSRHLFMTGSNNFLKTRVYQRDLYS
jgi:hypothetical protein